MPSSRAVKVGAEGLMNGQPGVQQTLAMKGQTAMNGG